MRTQKTCQKEKRSRCAAATESEDEGNVAFVVVNDKKRRGERDVCQSK